MTHRASYGSVPSAGWRQSRERGALVAMVVVSPVAFAVIVWSMIPSGLGVIEDPVGWVGLLLWVVAGAAGAIFAPSRRVWQPGRPSIMTALEMSVVAVILGGLAVMAIMWVYFSFSSGAGTNALGMTIVGGTIGFIAFSVPALLVSLPQAFVWLWLMRRPPRGS